MRNTRSYNGVIPVTKLVELSRSIGRLLLIWAIASIIIGLVTLFGYPGSIIAGIGLQAIIWGAIDAVIATYILVKQKEQSVEKIASTVYKNLYLDVVYQIVGVLIIITLFQDPYLLGNGIGVVIQGFFLFVLDMYYYKELRRLSTETSDV